MIEGYPGRMTSELTIHQALQQVWGYNHFRAPQDAIIRSILKGSDSLVLMPTGGGKSICFQLPAILQPGLTIVVSPLVALMENQVQALRERQVPAGLLHNELPASQRRQTLQALLHQRLRLLYVSPETLLSPPVWEVLAQPTLLIASLIIDEAHCLAQWGETFRPAYYRLGVVRSTLQSLQPGNRRIPIAAFTATANPAAQQTIERILQLQNPTRFQLSPYRDNLHLTVRIAWTPRGRRQQLLQYIQARPNQAGLVYVRTRRDSEELAEWLTQEGLQTAAYHAGLSATDRRQIERDWLGGALQFVVCTCAFGMGIDKSDVRWIIHFQAPLTLSEYVQEVGRGGRDGLPTEALTLVSEPTGWLDPGDQQRQRFFESQLRSQQQSAQKVAAQLPPTGSVVTVNRQFKQGDVALAWLHGAGQLDWLDPFHYYLKQSVPHAPLIQNNLSAAQQMHQYLYTSTCRWQSLLAHFGFAQTPARQPSGHSCGHCDNCQRQK